MALLFPKPVVDTRGLGTALRLCRVVMARTLKNQTRRINAKVTDPDLLLLRWAARVPMTVDEIALCMGMARAKVWRIERDARAKIRDVLCRDFPGLVEELTGAVGGGEA